MEYGSCHHGIIEIKKEAHETIEEMIRTLAHEITHETLSNQTALGSVMMLLQLISSHPQTSKGNAKQLEQMEDKALVNELPLANQQEVIFRKFFRKYYFFVVLTLGKPQC